MDLGLSDKNAIVTGSSSGLGYATAKLLLSENVNTIINGRDENKLTRAAETLNTETGKKPLFYPGDVTEHQFADRLLDFTKTNFPHLDILITNSGGPPPGRFEEFSDEEWQNAVELSFLSHVRLIRSFLPLLQKSKTPSVLTVTSFTVKQPLSNLILSNAIRAATIGLTKSLSEEFGQQGIRFNSILPGWTKTERVQQLLMNRANQNNSSIEIETEKITKQIALNRFATPEEFAKTALFLVSPAASYVTGVMLNVDGGVVKSVF
jgi:3-oxoacyl-[acyl-carrier protein] reductase